MMAAVKLPSARKALAVLGMIAWGVSNAAGQTLQGDCNNNNEISIGEVVRCANIFNMPSRLAECPSCDQNGDSLVSIGEVVGSSNCFLNPVADEGCRPVTPPPTATASPTLTPVPSLTPTNTLAPTDTPAPTNTMAPPTETPTTAPTNTPSETPTTAPTNTPTNSPVAPTPTATHTTKPITLDLTLQPSGGSNGNCRGTCMNGPTPGKSCSANSQCGTGGTCSTAKTCVGGPYDGKTCTSSTQCAECKSSGATNPFATGSCAVVQNKTFPLILAQNGVCVPRANPDVSCVTDVECPTGKTCQLPRMRMSFGPADSNGLRPVTIDPNEVFFPPAVLTSFSLVACVSGGGQGVGAVDCDGGMTGLNFDLHRDHNTTPQNVCARGTRAGQSCTTSADCPVPASTFPCVNSLCSGGVKVGVACTTPADCPDQPTALCNNPTDTSLAPGGVGNPGPSAGGFVDDATCDDNLTLPNGAPSLTCLEGSGSCVGGTSAGASCRVNADCAGGGQCSRCNNGSLHEGLCNSAIRAQVDGTFTSGDMVIVFPLAITTLSLTNVAERGPDGLFCTADDQPASPPASVPVTLSTGTNTINVYDAGANGFDATGQPINHITPDFKCGTNNCATRVTGQKLVCSDIDNAGTMATALKGATVGGGFPALDVARVGDIATVFRFEVLKATVVP